MAFKFKSESDRWLVINALLQHALSLKDTATDVRRSIMEGTTTQAEGAALVSRLESQAEDARRVARQIEEDAE